MKDCWFCETCVYYDNDKDEQPCCSCFDGVNHTESESIHAEKGC